MNSVGRWKVDQISLTCGREWIVLSALSLWNEHLIYLTENSFCIWTSTLWTPSYCTNYGQRMQVKMKKSKKETGQNSLPYLHIKYEMSVSPYTKLINWFWRGFPHLLIWCQISQRWALQLSYKPGGSVTQSLSLLAWFPVICLWRIAEGLSAKEFRKSVNTLLNS